MYNDTDTLTEKEIINWMRNMRSDKTKPEFWVRINLSYQEILDACRIRGEGIKQSKKPYNMSKYFDTLEEAQEYAFMAQLHGKSTDIINNRTQKVYE